MKLNMTNLKEAYCRVVAATGFGAANRGFEVIYEAEVKTAVQQTAHEDYADTLLQAAIRICTDEFYGWEVTDKRPEIKDETTFGDLFENWFRRIISPL
jgi:hypothetical protein